MAEPLRLVGQVQLWVELLEGFLNEVSQLSIRLSRIRSRFLDGVVGPLTGMSLGVVASDAVAVENLSAVLALNLVSP